MLTKDDFETARTPSQLYDWYHAKWHQIASDASERKAARLGTGLYSKFIQEVFPLAVFAKWRYPKDDVLCRPQIGSQGFDAVIYRPSAPSVVHNVEVTCPQNGLKNRRNAERLNRDGRLFRGDAEFRSFLGHMREYVRKAAESKSKKDYRNRGGSTLLILVDTSLSAVNDCERHAQVSVLTEEIRRFNFYVDSVFLVCSLHEEIVTVRDRLAA